VRRGRRPDGLVEGPSLPHDAMKDVGDIALRSDIGRTRIGRSDFSDSRQASFTDRQPIAR
jgi:hypothetical protein